jgi:aldose 1-epimerase
MNVGKRYICGFAILSLAFLNVQCKGKQNEDKQENTTQKMDSVSIEKSEYGKTAKGEVIDSYKMTNQKGMEVDIMTYGGRITSLKVPNKAGVSEDVVIGFNNFDQYTKDNPFFGALIGRYGNRIGKAKFSLD